MDRLHSHSFSIHTVTTLSVCVLSLPLIDQNKQPQTTSYEALGSTEYFIMCSVILLDFYFFDVKLSISIYISLKICEMFAQQNSVRQW